MNNISGSDGENKPERGTMNTQKISIESPTIVWTASGRVVNETKELNQSLIIEFRLSYFRESKLSYLITPYW